MEIGECIELCTNVVKETLDLLVVFGHFFLSFVIWELRSDKRERGREREDHKCGKEVNSPDFSFVSAAFK